ncbi:MAG: DUF429 domain-containing protein [Thermoprotei archaeon]
MYCGVDLAYKRPSSVAVFDGKKGVVYTLKNELLPPVLKSCKVVAVDAPFRLKSGYRDFELAMLSQGLRVFPPNFLRKLVEEFVKLAEASRLNFIETHPGATRKLSSFTFIEMSRATKNEEDAVICSIVAYLHALGRDYELKGRDGEIHLVRGAKVFITYQRGFFWVNHFLFGAWPVPVPSNIRKTRSRE